jgi:hypothetical protein
MNIHITDTDIPIKIRKELFILTREFLNNNSTWKLDILSNMIDSELILIPFPINNYYKSGMEQRLKKTNDLAKKYGIIAYGYISGDWAVSYPNFSNIVYLRMSGFKSTLSNNNKGFPVIISDQYYSYTGNQEFIPREKSENPIVCFCGHATLSFDKKAKELLKFSLENLNRFICNPMRSDWEPMFASAYERAKLLSILESSTSITTNFIYRDKYRAGAKNKNTLELTTTEYYNNLLELL